MCSDSTPMDHLWINTLKIIALVCAATSQNRGLIFTFFGFTFKTSGIRVKLASCRFVPELLNMPDCLSIPAR